MVNPKPQIPNPNRTFGWDLDLGIWDLGFTWSLPSGRAPHALIRVPVVPHAVVHFADEEIPLRVGREAVRMKELARVVTGVAPDIPDDLHRLTIDDANRLVRAVKHVEEALFLVR